MRASDRRRLKPGASVRVKRGHEEEGTIAHVIQYPYNNDILKILVLYDEEDYVWDIDHLTFVKEASK